MKPRRLVGIISRLLVGAVFIASAVTKCVSIDAFDMFVYEHQLFSWEVTTFVTRFLITLEAFVGIMLMLGIFPKQMRWLSISMLVFFTVYVLLKPILFDGIDRDNCHCFGTVILLSDKQTLIKNLVLLAISYFMFWDKGAVQLAYKVVEKKLSNGETIERYKKTFNGFLFSRKKTITIVTFIVLFILSLSVTMPEPIQRSLFPKTASIDREKFEVLMQQDSVQNLGVTQGKKIVCLFSTGCKYCKRSAIRLNVVRQKYDIADSSFAIIFWGDRKKANNFFAETNTKVLPYTFVSPYVFLPATKGKQPVIALMNNGNVEKLLKYPNINEDEIFEFLK